MRGVRSGGCVDEHLQDQVREIESMHILLVHLEYNEPSETYWYGIIICMYVCREISVLLCF